MSMLLLALAPLTSAAATDTVNCCELLTLGEVHTTADPDVELSDPPVASQV
jgi:hypothetical protein